MIRNEQVCERRDLFWGELVAVVMGMLMFLLDFTSVTVVHCHNRKGMDASDRRRV
jgi:hypothetical protein